MRILKLSSLTLLILLHTFFCYARKYKFAVDSTDATTKERVRIAEHKVGSRDFHKFGKLSVEQNGNKYYITFPFYLDIDYYATPEEEVMPKGTKVILKLSDGETVQSQTTQDIGVFLHFLWHDPAPYATRHSGDGGGGATPYAWHDNSTKPQLISYGSYTDYYGLDWLVKFEFTPSDMLLISKYGIIAASSMKNTKTITIPIKRNQSKKIQRSVTALLRK